MFKFKSIRPGDLEKIIAIKGLAQNGPSNRFSLTGGGQLDLTMPHDAYLVGLSSLQSNNPPRAEASGIRVIETSDSRFNLIYELLPVAGSGNEPQMVKDQTYIRDYEKAFGQLFNSGKEEGEYEVRSLKVPALNVEALWLHNEAEEDEDWYLPVRSIGLFEVNQLYDKSTFFSTLREAASRYDFQDDQLGG